MIWYDILKNCWRLNTEGKYLWYGPPTAIQSYCPLRTTVVLCSREIWLLTSRRCLETCSWQNQWILQQMGCRHPTSSKGRSLSRSEAMWRNHFSLGVLFFSLCPWSPVFFFYILKHKKLAEGSAYEEVFTSTPYSENDISNSIKNGILYLEDPINHVSMFKCV